MGHTGPRRWQDFGLGGRTNAQDASTVRQQPGFDQPSQQYKTSQHANANGPVMAVRGRGIQRVGKLIDRKHHLVKLTVCVMQLGRQRKNAVQGRQIRGNEFQFRGGCRSGQGGGRLQPGHRVLATVAALSSNNGDGRSLLGQRQCHATPNATCPTNNEDAFGVVKREQVGGFGQTSVAHSGVERRVGGTVEDVPEDVLKDGREKNEGNGVFDEGWEVHGVQG